MTDLENLYGQVKHHHAARAHGIRAITGVELRRGYGRRAGGSRVGRLVLLARDREGFASLCRIVTARRTAREGVTPDPLQCLAARPSGLFYLSDDPAVIAALLAAGVDRDEVRFLLVRPDGAHGAGAVPHGVRAVADTDALLLSADDRDLHALLAAIRQQVPFGAAVGVEAPGRRLPTPRELALWFDDVPEALAESLRVAEACTLDLCEAPRAVPPVEDPDGAFRRLARRARARLAAGRAAGAWAGAAYDERLERELDAVRALGLGGHLLIAAEIADRARAEAIGIAARGSAVGALLVHVLGISAVDPVAHGLLFERFLHAGRGVLPDLDLDVSAHRRDALIAWVTARFGPERVAGVAAHATFRRRAALREGLKAFGAGPAEIARFSERLPAPDVEDDLDLPLPWEALSPRRRGALPLIERLVGRPQHVSVHPGGLVIAAPRIDRYAPLEQAPKGVCITQFDVASLAQLGLVKIDLLGNRALSAIEVAVTQLATPATVPDDDAATLATLDQARTLGCFEIESPPVRGLLARLPIRGRADLVAALALVRPGPASGAAKDAYVRRARGEEPATPVHPRLADLLHESLGLLLYEEDLILAIARLTGWPVARADRMREALIDAGDDPVAREALAGGFLAAAARTGLPRREGRAVWDTLARFAAYTFNRAHATSHAAIAWRCAWLKTHHPLAYAAGVLTHYGGQYPLRTVAAEFARIGLTLRAPHVNTSAAGHTLEGGRLRLGLTAVTRVSAAGRRRLLAARPFADLRDLLRRVRLPLPELEALILAGACDGLAPLAAHRYPLVHEALIARLHATRSEQALDGLTLPEVRGPEAEKFQRLVRAFNEVRFLGMHPSGHPMALLRDDAARAGCVDSRALARLAGRAVRFAGIVAASRRLVTARRQLMQFVTLEDEHGLVECVVDPAAYAALHDPIRTPGPYLVAGRVEAEHGERLLAITEAVPFHLRRAASAGAVG